MGQLRITREQWPLKEPFIIARAVQEQGEVVVVEIERNGAVGRGECEEGDVFFEGRDQVVKDIDAMRTRIETGLTRDELQDLMPAGAARNAVDCALWDLEARLSGVPVWKMAGCKTRCDIGPQKRSYNVIVAE